MGKSESTLSLGILDNKSLTVWPFGGLGLNPPPSLGLEVVVNLVVVSSVVVWVLGWKLLTLFGPNLGLKPAALAPENKCQD